MPDFFLIFEYKFRSKPFEAPQGSWSEPFYFLVYLGSMLTSRVKKELQQIHNKEHISVLKNLLMRCLKQNWTPPPKKTHCWQEMKTVFLWLDDDLSNVHSCLVNKWWFQVFIDTEAEAVNIGVNILATAWHMPQINDFSAVPISFWCVPAASRGCSWLEAGHGAPPGQLWRGSANRRIRRCEEHHSCRMLKLNLCGCAKLRASADKYAQQVLAERMDSSVPLSWQPEEFSSKNFRHVRTVCVVQEHSFSAGSSGFDTRSWQVFHAGIRTWSHRRRHVMANVLPGCALASLLSSSTSKVTI